MGQIYFGAVGQFCIGGDTYKALLERLDNLELNAPADARLAVGDTPAMVLLDDL